MCSEAAAPVPAPLPSWSLCPGQLGSASLAPPGAGATQLPRVPVCRQELLWSVGPAPPGSCGPGCSSPGLRGLAGVRLPPAGPCALGWAHHQGLSQRRLFPGRRPAGHQGPPERSLWEPGWREAWDPLCPPSDVHILGKGGQRDPLPRFTEPSHPVSCAPDRSGSSRVTCPRQEALLPGSLLRVQPSGHSTVRPPYSSCPSGPPATEGPVGGPSTARGKWRPRRPWPPTSRQSASPSRSLTRSPRLSQARCSVSPERAASPHHARAPPCNKPQHGSPWGSGGQLRTESEGDPARADHGAHVPG